MKGLLCGGVSLRVISGSRTKTEGPQSLGFRVEDLGSRV